MIKYLFLICVILFNVYPVLANEWIHNSTLELGLYDIDQWNTPTVFNISENMNIISGYDSGDFVGFTWNGTQWNLNESLIVGLTDIGTSSTPDIFYIGTTLNLLSGRSNGTFISFVWDGAQWDLNESFVNGLGDIGSGTDPTIFYKWNKYNLISGKSDGTFSGYTWDGLQWNLNSSLVSGLVDVGTYSTPEVFYNSNNILEIIIGENEGSIIEYYYNDYLGLWVHTDDYYYISDYLLGNDYATNPSIFYMNSILYFISGSEYGEFYAFTQGINNFNPSYNTYPYPWLYFIDGANYTSDRIVSAPEGDYITNFIHTNTYGEISEGMITFIQKYVDGSSYAPQSTNTMLQSKYFENSTQFDITVYIPTWDITSNVDDVQYILDLNNNAIFTARYDGDLDTCSVNTEDNKTLDNHCVGSFVIQDIAIPAGNNELKLLLNPRLASYDTPLYTYYSYSIYITNYSNGIDSEPEVTPTPTPTATPTATPYNAANDTNRFKSDGSDVFNGLFYIILLAIVLLLRSVFK